MHHEHSIDIGDVTTVQSTHAVEVRLRGSFRKRRKKIKWERSQIKNYIQFDGRQHPGADDGAFWFSSLFGYVSCAATRREVRRTWVMIAQHTNAGTYTAKHSWLFQCLEVICIYTEYCPGYLGSELSASIKVTDRGLHGSRIRRTP